VTTGVLLLAAGQSRRFGADKRHARLADDRSLLEAVLDTVAAAGLPVLVCLGPDDDSLQAMLAERGVESVICHNASQGMGATLAEGMAALPGWQAVVVGLADMPWVRPGTWRRLADAATPATICAPVYRGRRGNPVAFGSGFFAALRESSGDIGARALVESERDHLLLVDVDDPGVLRDVDLPSDLSAAPVPPGPGCQ
jgi:molybdenum cofactor cytidylyltransferase